MSTHGFQHFSFSALPDPSSKPKSYKAFKPTLEARSAKTRISKHGAFTLKTAKRELATSEGHSSWRPLVMGSEGRRQALPPPHYRAGLSSPIQVWRRGALSSHQRLCNPRQVPCPLRSVNQEDSEARTQSSSKALSLWLWWSSRLRTARDLPGHLIQSSPLPSTYRQGR